MLDRASPTALLDVGETGRDGLAVLGVDHVEQGVADEVGGRVAHGALDRRAHVGESTVGAAHGEDVRRALHEGAEAGLRPQQSAGRGALHRRRPRDDGRRPPGDEGQEARADVALRRLDHGGDVVEGDPGLAAGRRRGRRCSRPGWPSARVARLISGTATQASPRPGEHAPAGEPAEGRDRGWPRGEPEARAVLERAAAELRLRAVVRRRR